MTPFTTTQLLAALEHGMRAGESLPGEYALAVVDDGGHPIAQLRHPDAPPGAADSALAKAVTAARLGADTGAVPPTSPIVPALVSGVPWPVNIFPGGLLLHVGGVRVGAVGAAGSTDPANDLAAATVLRDALEGR